MLTLGDIIVAVIDLSLGEISFRVNDEDFGVAFAGIDTSQTYFPAVSLLTKQQVGAVFRCAKPWPLTYPLGG